MVLLAIMELAMGGIEAMTIELAIDPIEDTAIELAIGGIEAMAIELAIGGIEAIAIELAMGGAAVAAARLAPVELGTSDIGIPFGAETGISEPMALPSRRTIGTAEETVTRAAADI